MTGIILKIINVFLVPLDAIHAKIRIIAKNAKKQNNMELKHIEEKILIVTVLIDIMEIVIK